MTRWHGDHQPIKFTPLYGFEMVCYECMMRGSSVPGKRVTYEVDQMTAGEFTPCQFRSR